MIYSITNIKVSLKSDCLCLNSVQQKLIEKNISFTSYTNFIVIRHNFTYILFKTGKNNNNHINITKIKKLENIDNAVENLKEILFECKFNEIFRKVDNITASVSVNKTINLQSLTAKFQNEKISYNPEKFPGLFIKFSVGTIILFHTGKCILIGSKKISDIECLVQKLVDI